MSEEGTAPAPLGGYGTRRQIVVKTIVGLVVLVALSALLSHFVRGPLESVGHAFVSSFGHVGVLVGVLLIDTSPVPLITEPLLYVALAGGMPPLTVAVAGCAGSLLAAFLGYTLGRMIGDTRFVNWLVGERRAKAERFVKRYGFWGIATAALTPIPFAICAWSAGALRMPLGAFAAASLFRIPKTCFFVWLMLQGYLAAS